MFWAGINLRIAHSFPSVHFSEKKCTGLSFFCTIVASLGSKQRQTGCVSQQPGHGLCHRMLLVIWGLSRLNDSSLLKFDLLLHFSHFSLHGQILGPRSKQACTTLKKDEKQKEPKPSWWGQSILEVAQQQIPWYPSEVTRLAAAAASMGHLSLWKG